jgi:hypothetical protein
LIRPLGQADKLLLGLLALISSIGWWASWALW